RWMLRADAPLYVPPRWDPALWLWFAAFARRCNMRDWEHGTRVKADLLLRSRDALQQLVVEEGLQCAFASSGLWHVFRDAAALDAMQAECALLERFGVHSEVLGGTAARAAEPALAEAVVGAIHFPGDASLRPNQLVAELARRVRELGGRIEAHTRVDAIVASADGVRCATRSGARAAPHAVLACGAWSPRLARSLGLRLPVQPGKGYSITYQRPSPAPRRPLVLEEASVCVTTWPDGLRLGSTMEFSGYDSRLNRV